MGIKRYELSDAPWHRIEPMLPGKISDPGRTANDNRLFINGVWWVLRSGARWSDLPERYPCISASPVGRWLAFGNASSPCSHVTATTNIL
jgi:transposase